MQLFYKLIVPLWGIYSKQQRLRFKCVYSNVNGVITRAKRNKQPDLSSTNWKQINCYIHAKEDHPVLTGKG